LQNLALALKKLSITDEQVELIREYVSKKLTGHKIAKKLGLSQPRIWRNMEMLGLNKKKNRSGCINKEKENTFKWEDFKNKSVI